MSTTKQSKVQNGVKQRRRKIFLRLACVTYAALYSVNLFISKRFPDIYGSLLWQPLESSATRKYSRCSSVTRLAKIEPKFEPPNVTVSFHHHSKEDHDQFYNESRHKIQSLVNILSILNMEPKTTPQAFLPFLNMFDYDSTVTGTKNEPKLPEVVWADTSRHFVLEDTLCAASINFRLAGSVKKHILFVGVGENFGALSTYVPKRTAPWGFLECHLEEQGCTMDSVMQYIDHPNTLAVITSQFQSIDHPKVHSLPLGIMKKDWLLEMITFLPSTSDERDTWLLMSAKRTDDRESQISDIERNFESRPEMLRFFPGGGKAMNHRLYLKALAESKFVFCPSGMGWDTYRMWEALVMGAIPVVERYGRRDGWHRSTDGLPVLWLNTTFGNELTPDLLERKYEEMVYNASRYQYEKLTMWWWKNYVNSFLPPKPKGELNFNSRFLNASKYNRCSRAKALALALIEPKFVRVQTHVSPSDKPVSADDVAQFYNESSHRLKSLLNVTSIIDMDTEAGKDQAFLPLLNMFDYDSPINFEGVKNAPRAPEEIWNDTSRFFVFEKSPCFAAKNFRKAGSVKKHILFTGLGENFGAFSSFIPNRTADWGQVECQFEKDGCFMAAVMDYVDHPNTLAVITSQFQSVDHPKIHSVPIGITKKDALLQVVNKLPAENSERQTILLMATAVTKDRAPQIEDVKYNFREQSGMIRSFDGGKDEDQRTYLEALSQSRFVFCPSGLGWDTYRAWEALALGAFPVIEKYGRKDGWQRTFEGLPVLFLPTTYRNDLTPELLNTAYERMAQQASQYKYEKLTLWWWRDFINSFLPEAAES